MNNSFQNTLLVLELWGLDGLLLNRTSVFVALLLRKLGRDTEKKEKAENEKTQHLNRDGDRFVITVYLRSLLAT